MDLKDFFKDFNPSKFVVFFCLFLLSIFLSLKLNGSIDWSIWVIFTPFWILDIIVLLGATIGSIIWCRHSQYRAESDGYSEYKAMLITVGLHLLLLMFQVLLCDKIESRAETLWILVFTPLFFAFPISIAACVWGFRQDRSLELELFLSVNIIFFIFVALRLDNFILWSWTVVFIPLWILMCIPSFAVLYYFIWTLAFFRTSYPEFDRTSHLIMSITWWFVLIPLLTFEVLLAHKLDRFNYSSWSSVFIPLHICLAALIISTFGSKGGNKWWFGIRMDFCHFVLEHCPFVRLYGNVSYKAPSGEDRHPIPNQPRINSHILGASGRTIDVLTPSTGRSDMVVIETIDTPD